MSNQEIERMRELVKKLRAKIITEEELKEYYDLSSRSFKETYDRFTG